jgi:uncharacterized protein YkwD
MDRALFFVIAALLLIWYLAPDSTKPPPSRPFRTPAKPPCQDGQCEIKRRPIGSPYELEVARLVNLERTRRGLGPLKVSEKLMLDARSWSHNQATRSRMYHSRMGYGENVAYGQDNPQEVMQAWMNSRGHRANILNGRYTTIGVGAVTNGRSIYWTQVFQ